MKIYTLGNIPESLYPSIGGKASGLDELIKKGFNVPKGFLITEIDNIDEEEIFKTFDELKLKKVSVRSSASNEDKECNSNAGQYDTYLFVNKDNLIESINKCKESLTSLRAKEYAEHFHLKEGEMNIVVQEMIDSRKAGVLFTASPNNGSHILIEAVKGQGENLVSGKVSANRYEISRKNYIDKSDDLLNKEELKELYDIAKKIREVYKEDKDIEWAINGHLYLLQMRPITTEIVDIEEFDRDEDLSGHLFTKRNVGEMMPGAVTPLTLSTSAKAIDYGMRYMLWKAGVYKSPYEEGDLKLISSISGHLFFDMNLLYAMHAKVAIANPQSMNLSIMGEYRDYPPVTKKYSCALVRGINSLKFLTYVFSGNKALKQFDKLLTKVKFIDTEDTKKLYESIDNNIPLLDESLIYHYAASSYSGSATSTLYMMLDKYFPDKKEYQAFNAKLLSNIPNIESADVLLRLQNIGEKIVAKDSNAKTYDEKKLLTLIKSDDEINSLYEEFLRLHGHRCIKEAEMRNKPWRDDQIPLLNYLRSIINSPMNLTQKEDALNLKEYFSFVKNPLLRKACISYGKKSRQAVVDREYTKSRLIKIIDLFKIEYRKLATLMVRDNLLDEEDNIYFLTHKEIGELINGKMSLKAKTINRKKAYNIQETLCFDDTYIGKPLAISDSEEESSDELKGVSVSVGESEGIVRVVNSIEDANKLKQGEIMVAKFTDIGWTPYYSVVNGLITEIGSSLSHGAVVAREYNLPTLVNVKGATTKLKNGDHIHIDGTKGTVTIIR